jgi:hypothetical protein
MSTIIGALLQVKNGPMNVASDTSSLWACFLALMLLAKLRSVINLINRVFAYKGRSIPRVNLLLYVGSCSYLKMVQNPEIVADILSNFQQCQ